MSYEQKYHVLNKALGEILLHADMIKTIAENADIQVGHLALNEEKPPHGGNRESGIDK